MGGFTADHLNGPEFWLPAALLHSGVIVQIALALRQRLELKALDHSAPVLTIQKRPGVIRLRRVRTVKWTLWLSPLLWTPLLIVGLKGLLDLNAYEILPPGFLVANLWFGPLFPLLMIRLARHFTDRFSGTPRLEQLMDHFAGRSLAAALAGLSEIADFESERATA